jgi:acyl-CoA reductase-like NAD-dependent aldehyde dehydrogenase
MGPRSRAGPLGAGAERPILPMTFAAPLVNGGKFTMLAPSGGYEQSGNGRELGRYGIEEFLEVKAIQR